MREVKILAQSGKNLEQNLEYVISYELILSSAILIIILLSGSLNYITIIEIRIKFIKIN